MQGDRETGFYMQTRHDRCTRPNQASTSRRAAAQSHGNRRVALQIRSWLRTCGELGQLVRIRQAAGLVTLTLLRDTHAHGQ